LGGPTRKCPRAALLKILHAVFGEGCPRTLPPAKFLNDF